MYTIAARVAPTNGATTNTHTWAKAFPPKNIAGAMLLAGFTEVPVKLMPNKCTNANVSPITIPAMLDFD